MQFKSGSVNLIQKKSTFVGDKQQGVGYDQFTLNLSGSVFET